MGTVPERSAISVLPPPLSSSSPCVTEFHITGFSSFHNVPINPTELMLTALPEYLEKNPLSSNTTLKSTRVIRVAAQTAREELRKLHANVSNDVRTVIIHLGVNASVSRFHLEIQGRNEATFSCPDELGWTPIKHPIDPTKDLSAVCQTSLKLDPLIQALRQKGFEVDISTDAGRFVCNWIYYNSLSMAASNVCPLFVHVPPQRIVPIGRQLEFLHALLNIIADTHT